MSSALAQPMRRSATPLSGIGLAAILALAFAAPALLGAAHGLGAATERRLGLEIVQAFGGITLPVVGAAVAAIFLANGSRMRSWADALVSAGETPTRAILRPVLTAIACAAVATSIVGAAVVVALRVKHHLGTGGAIASDALYTAWSMALGAAAWTALAAALVVRTGRAGRGYLLVAIDLGSRLLPGGTSWLAPSTHVANLLGAPPPRGIVHVGVLPQWASIAALGAMAVVGVAAAVKRYAGRA